MVIKEMKQFEETAKGKLLEWYRKQNPNIELTQDDVYVVLACKTLQNFKCLVAARASDGIYAEYTYNGNKQELYEDIYTKIHNEAHL